MKKVFSFFQGDTIGSLLKHIGVTFGTLAFIAIGYFYIYLPNSTNHGDSLKVPDLMGLPSEKLDSLLTAHNLRFEVGDSSYSDEYKALAVIRQFPHAGSIVKPGRKIFVSVNRVNPPTVPLPAVMDLSLINAIATLKSNDLKPGKIYYRASPFPDLVLEMWLNGVKAEPEKRVPKGTVVDLVVGDGAGPNDMVANNLIGYTLEEAEAILSAASLNLGTITIPSDVDTTGIVVYVVKQLPQPGDSIRLGHPINLWLGPKDYVVKDSVNVENP